MSVSGEPPSAAPNVHASKVAIVKTVAIICASFLLSYTAINGNRSLQSSLYPDNRGSAALTINNLASVVSNLLLPTLVLTKLGLKWSIVVCLLVNVLYQASNLYAAQYSIYAGAAITGLAQGPLWSSKSVYLTRLGEEYAALSGESPEVVITRFFGIFFMLHRSTMFTGNIISSIVIRRPPSSDNALQKSQHQDNDMDAIPSLCGAHYCQVNADALNQHRSGNATATLSYHPTTVQTDLVFAIYVLSGLLAVVLSTTIVPMTGGEPEAPMNTVDALLAPLLHMKTLKEILVIPMSFVTGVTNAFITVNYTVGFVTCSNGIDSVGNVIAVFGIAAGFGSVMPGQMLKFVSRKAIFAFGALGNAATLVGMLKWPPAPHSIVNLCILAALWGITTAISSSQLVVFIAIVFRNVPKEVAFACNYLWYMTGVCLWPVISVYMCIDVQIYAIAGFLVVAMVSYAALELMLKGEEKYIDLEVDAALDNTEK